MLFIIIVITKLHYRLTYRSDWGTDELKSCVSYMKLIHEKSPTKYFIFFTKNCFEEIKFT